MTYEEEFVHECAYCKKKFSSYSAGAGWLYKNKQNWKRKWFCGFECYQKGYREGYNKGFYECQQRRFNELFTASERAKLANDALEQLIDATIITNSK